MNLTSAYVISREINKTSADRWREVKDFSMTVPKAMGVGVGGLFISSLAPDGMRLPVFALGAVIANFVWNSLSDDMPSIAAAVEQVGHVAARSPLDINAADTFGVSSQELYDIARTVHTRGVPQVGTKMIRPPM